MYFQADVRSTYERLFDPPEGFDCKMHRDDRKSVHRIGCAIHDEVCWVFFFVCF